MRDFVLPPRCAFRRSAQMFLIRPSPPSSPSPPLPLSKQPESFFLSFFFHEAVERFSVTKEIGYQHFLTPLFSSPSPFFFLSPTGYESKGHLRFPPLHHQKKGSPPLFYQADGITCAPLPASFRELFPSPFPFPPHFLHHRLHSFFSLLQSRAGGLPFLLLKVVASA